MASGASWRSAERSPLHEAITAREQPGLQRGRPTDTPTVARLPLAGFGRRQHAKPPSPRRRGRPGSPPAGRACPPLCARSHRSASHQARDSQERAADSAAPHGRCPPVQTDPNRTRELGRAEGALTPGCPAGAAGLWSPWAGQRDCPTGQPGMGAPTWHRDVEALSWSRAPRRLNGEIGQRGGGRASSRGDRGWRAAAARAIQQ
jgi:hypothetical protein